MLKPLSPNPPIPYSMDYYKSLGGGQDCRHAHTQTDGQPQQYHDLAWPKGQGRVKKNLLEKCRYILYIHVGHVVSAI